MLIVPRFAFIKPALLMTAESPPSGPEWVHEIKHDGYRMMARRDAAGIRLLTRNGYDWPQTSDEERRAESELTARSTPTSLWS
jgi:bifunctional non-homologous end joining protein LigD